MWFFKKKTVTPISINVEPEQIKTAVKEVVLDLFISKIHDWVRKDLTLEQSKEKAVKDFVDSIKSDVESELRSYLRRQALDEAVSQTTKAVLEARLPEVLEKLNAQALANAVLLNAAKDIFNQGSSHKFIDYDSSHRR